MTQLLYAYLGGYAIVLVACLWAMVLDGVPRNPADFIYYCGIACCVAFVVATWPVLMLLLAIVGLVKLARSIGEQFNG